ncbi:macrophage mannose receptor 1-like [Xyrauchen texanus]|uniref:macrophage mannose receptor 1-like n=1 Tax=Xyrauchen texanus TaxID=154827 RepID=UPI002241F9FA|nr:macrophage mannose receptor 1-like [Xyrauchen texanus]XP_051996702.1 macrophage mannose receptor 1-like [Xyrauchen texanus]
MEQDLLQVLLLLGVLSGSLSFRGQYILIQQPKTWSEAQAFCRANHLDLATLNNDNDRNNFRNDLAASNFKSDVWVGLYQYSDNKTWRWSFQDENITFDSWNSNEPNNRGGNEKCVHFYSPTTWNDATCSKTFYCFCYDGETDKFILVKDKTRTWYEAQSYCRQHYTDLATVRNMSDQEKLKQLMEQQSGNSYIWIGLFRDFWKWSDGTNITSFKWILGQPANNGACAYANSEGNTGDKACSDPLPFVCNSVIKKIHVRVELKSDQNMADPKVQDTILQQIQQKLKQSGMAADAELTWKVQVDGQVFHVKENYTRQQNWKTCDIP